MERVEQATPLALATDHRCPRALWSPAGVGCDRKQAVGLERLALALDRQRGDRLGLHRVTDETERVSPEEYVSWARRLLEPRRDVDDVPCREVASTWAGAGDGLAGVHSDAHRELDTALSAQLPSNVVSFLVPIGFGMDQR